MLGGCFSPPGDDVAVEVSRGARWDSQPESSDAVEPGNLQDVVSRLQERQLVTERKLEQQQQRIDELTAKLIAQDNQGAANTEAPDEGGDILKPVETFVGEEVSMYEFDQSIWDATMLLYVTPTSIADMVVIVVGILLNLALQGVLLITIQLNLIGNPYDDATLQSMIDWRVKTGQSVAAFNSATRKSRVDMLCSGELWAFERSEYEEIESYLYKTVPGFMLSLMAVILWTLTCMKEYRAAFEQLLAILKLPGRPGHGRRQIKESDEEAEIIGIGPAQRILAVFTLTLPRMGVLAALLIIGCNFLSQTVSLSDIVLNAVALAFVLDVDEGLCHVLLSQRLRGLLDKLQPIPCAGSINTIAGITKKDALRYTLTFAMLIFTVFYWLLPFRDSVESAGIAICGGRQDFIYSGGSKDYPTVAVVPTSGFVRSCEADTLKTYLASTYNATLTDSDLTPFTSLTISRAARKSALDDEQLERNTQQAIIAYSFLGQGCPAGEIRHPLHGDAGEQECAPIPDPLDQVLKKHFNIDLRNAMLPGSCKVFEPKLGWDTCTAPNQVACNYPFQSYRCEGGEELSPPGKFHYDACLTNDIRMQCQTWEKIGKTDHPRRNCDYWNECDGTDPRCFCLKGTIRFVVSNASALEPIMNKTETIYKNAIRTALALPTTAQVNISEILGGTGNAGTRLLQAQDSNESAYDLTLSGLQDSLKRKDVANAGANITAEINKAIKADTGESDVVDSTSMSTFEFYNIQELTQIQSYCFVNAPGDSCPRSPSSCLESEGCIVADMAPYMCIDQEVARLMREGICQVPTSTTTTTTECWSDCPEEPEDEPVETTTPEPEDAEDDPVETTTPEPEEEYTAEEPEEPEYTTEEPLPDP